MVFLCLSRITGGKKFTFFLSKVYADTFSCNQLSIKANIRCMKFIFQDQKELKSKSD